MMPLKTMGQYGRRDPEWRKILLIECALLLALLTLTMGIIGVSVYYEHERVFTNWGLILVFGGILAELIGRLRHLRRMRGIE